MTCHNGHIGMLTAGRYGKTRVRRWRCEQRGPDPAKQAELRDLRERMMLQGTRLTSAKGAIDNMRRVQAQSGLGMRQDVLTAQQRAEFYMDEAEAALKSGDPAAMRKALDSAEREIERLDTFLGR